MNKWIVTMCIGTLTGCAVAADDVEQTAAVTQGIAAARNEALAREVVTAVSPKQPYVGALQSSVAVTPAKRILTPMVGIRR